MMERDRSEYSPREEFVVRPGETRVVRGDSDVVDTGETSVGRPSEVGATGARDDDEAGTEEIRADIEQTRAEMSQTIDAIQEKLNPDTLKEQAAEAVRDATEQAKEAVREATVGRAEQVVSDAQDTVRGAGTSIMDMIKQNPVPLALVGAGLGWLFLNRQRQSSGQEADYYVRGRSRDRYDDTRVRGSRLGSPGYREASYRPEYYETGEEGGGPQQRVGEIAGRAQERVGDVTGRAQERVGDVAGRTQERVGELASRTGDTAGELAGRAQETVGEFADQARYQMGRARGGFQQQLVENPLALGALALGLGVAVGFAAPETRREDELLGEARDNLLGQARSAVQDTGQRVQRVVERVQEEAQQESQS